MAGISEYNRRVGGGFYGFYEQGQGDGPFQPNLPPQSQSHAIHQGSGDDYNVGVGGMVRSSSRTGAEYYGGSGRAVSPYGIPYSPRIGYAYGSNMDAAEGAPHNARFSNANSRNFTPLSFNTSNGFSPTTDSSEEQNIQTVAAKGAGLLAIVVENLLSHPFLVFKRQCQVHTQSERYHLFPITLIRPIFHICQRQGVAVLWKGLGSTLVVRGMTLAVEDVTSKVSPLPKEISRHSSMKAFCQHLLLKGLSIAVVTPFYAASLVETVQSDVASETAGFFDVFREGFWRLLSWPSTGRLVPLHLLIVPTVAHGVLSYLIYTGIKSVSLSTIRRVRESKERKQGALSRDPSIPYDTEMTASLVGNMTASIILYPLETILNRLHLQGTRTIIDSLDNGFEVTPILTSYGGALDCLRTTVDDEGVSGLYKGFGSLVLQYGLQILVIRTMKIIIENSPFGGNGSTTPPTQFLDDKSKIYSQPHGTPTVSQSKSDTNVNASRTTPIPIDSITRRTPPTREYSWQAAETEEGARYRSNARYSNYSPNVVR